MVVATLIEPPISIGGDPAGKNDLDKKLYP